MWKSQDNQDNDLERCPCLKQQNLLNMLRYEIKGSLDEIQLSPWRWDVILDDQQGFDLITCFLKIREPFAVDFRISKRSNYGRIARDVKMMTLKMEEEQETKK